MYFPREIRAGKSRASVEVVIESAERKMSDDIFFGDFSENKFGGVNQVCLIEQLFYVKLFYYLLIQLKYLFK